MSDHYHYASEIEGAALDGHSHSARETGAADEHDFTMLARDMRAAEATIIVLERQNSRQHAEIQALTSRMGDLEESFRRHAEHSITLAEQVKTIARHLAQRI